MGFVASAFLLILDFNYRSTVLLATLSPGWVAVAALWLVAALGPLALAWGALTAGVESAVAGLPPRLRPRRGRPTLFLGFLLLLWVNLVYARVYGLLVLSLTPADLRWSVLALGVGALASWPWLAGPRMEDLRPLWQGAFPVGRAVTIGAVLGATLTLLVPREAPAAGGTPVSAQRPHVLLITADSLAAANMSLYGYLRPTTPNLQALASTFHVFDHAQANSNATYHSMPCFQGRLPAAPPGPGLPEVLGEHGYDRRLFLTFTPLEADFRRGFTRVEVLLRAEDLPLCRWLDRTSVGSRPARSWLTGLLSETEDFVNPLSPRNPKDFNETRVDLFPTDLYLDRTLEALEDAESPLFVWTHLFQPHHPFVSSPPFQGRFGTSLEDRYDAAISELDDRLGTFLRALDQRGLSDRVLIVLSSDHGESFGLEEGGWTGRLHGTNWSNRKVNWIPLMMRLPGERRGSRVGTFAQQADLAPTLLDILGIPVPAGFEGESLVASLDDPDRRSDQLKISVPESYFIRHEGLMTSCPPNWVTEKEEMFVTWLQPYRVGWFQVYEQDPEGPEGRITRQVDVILWGVHDLEKDPDLQRDLSQEPGVQSIVKHILNHPVTARYRRPPGSSPDGAESGGVR